MTQKIEVLDVLEFLVGPEVISYTDHEAAKQWADDTMALFALAEREGDESFFTEYPKLLRLQARMKGVVVARAGEALFADRVRLLTRLVFKLSHLAA